MPPIPRAALVASALLVTAFIDAAGQVPGRPPERGADLLSVDFVVVTQEGYPVADLRAEDVALRIGGRRRTIRSLQMIADLDEHDPSVPLPFATNAGRHEGRAFSLVIDDDSFRAGREADLREAVGAFIDGLGPADRLSLVTMPYGGIKVPFTTDHSRVQTALMTVIGQASGTESGSEMACRTGRTLESLIGYLDAQGIREAPLTVLFITGGLAAPRRDAPVMMAPGRCELRAEVFTQVGEAAGAARASFYVIQPSDQFVKGTISRENIAGVGFLGSDNPIEGIEHLAGVTGGKMLNLKGEAEGGALGRVLRETTAYYRATFEPDGSDRSGRSQQLDIRVSRTGVELRARPHVTFPRHDRMSRIPAEPSARDMIGVPTVFRDLPLRATAYTALESDPAKLRVITIAEPVQPGVKLGSLVAALFDREGTLASHWTATSQELDASTIVGAMPAEPGFYRLRVAAIDTSGRAGTVDYELEVAPVRSGPLRLSSLVLGLSREGRFIPRLRFTNEPVAIAYLEMDGAAPGTRISAAVELARTMNGPALSSVPLAIEAVAGNRYAARGAVPLGSLPPGDYIVRALVGIEGHPVTRVVRTVRKGS